MAPGGPPGGGSAPERFEPAVLAGLPPGFALKRLPVGRHGLTRAQVFRNQRMRLVEAMLQMLARRSYAEISIGNLAEQAGVSRSTFYEQFEDKEECFLVTYDLAARWFCERVERAMGARGEWPARVHAGVVEALRLLAGNRSLARLFAVDVLHAGPTARERQRACLARLAEALRVGRADRVDLPAELEEMLLGGALATIARYVDSDRIEQLPDATTELLQYLLIPYLGPGETQRIARAA